ncbi:hypothetical protein CEXT_521941 [Caerostris extrusa]|uniref:Uncharacterized protein n=1 Tax=Caerostris extrusa TaxID=172846 RepID=A0AAV4SN29_CAEEX|nr:hypothetical protein CEXT_521941 [Caerostris extrusa]
MYIDKLCREVHHSTPHISIAIPDAYKRELTHPPSPPSLIKVEEGQHLSRILSFPETSRVSGRVFRILWALPSSGTFTQVRIMGHSGGPASFPGNDEILHHQRRLWE